MPSQEPMASHTHINKKDIQSWAQALGFDLVGTVPADEFPTVPSWACSVIILGMPSQDPAFNLEIFIEEDGTQRWSKWIYERLVASAARLAIMLQRRGYRAEPLNFDDSLAVLDLKIAAVRAGLGVWGLDPTP